jgi:uncharacterized protein (DUF58 family)
MKSKDILTDAYTIASLIGESLARSYRNNLTAYGENQSRQSGVGNEFWQHREYSAGDALNVIDWRLSARNDRVYVREHEQEKKRRFVIWRDGSASMDVSTDRPINRFYRANLITLVLIIILSEAGEQVSYACKDLMKISKSSDINNLADILGDTQGDTQAGQSLKESNISPANFDEYNSSSTILISDCMVPAEEIKRWIISTGANTLVELRDELESYNHKGRILFIDPESGAQIEYGDAAAIQSEYEAAYAAHLLSIKEICTQYSAAHVVISGGDVDSIANAVRQIIEGLA